VETKSLEFRQSHGIIIPFVKVKGIMKAVRTITIGPLIKKNIAMKTLECLVKDKGMTVPIGQSTVPIRY